MAIDHTKNTRINLTLPIKTKQTLELLSRDDMRSTNSFILLLIKEALEQPKWKERIERLKHDE